MANKSTKKTNTQKATKKNQKSSARPKGQKPKRSKTSSVGMGGTVVRSLPAGEATLHPTRSFSFSAAPNKGGRDGLRITFCVPYLNLAVGASSVSGGPALQPATGSLAASIFFDPNVAGVWLHSGVPLVSGAFARYMIAQGKKKGNKAVFQLKYRQNSGASNESAPFYCGWVDDPAHPTVSAPTIPKIENLQHFITFNGWENWDMDCRVDDTILHYSSADGATVAGQRLSFPGAFICLQGFASSAAKTYGILYLEGTIDLYDFSPIATVSAPMEVQPYPYPVARLRTIPEDDEKSDSSSQSGDFEVLRRAGPRYSAVPLKGSRL